jgi:putative nucleotidyltransferase with HDIG domain
MLPKRKKIEKEKEKAISRLKSLLKEMVEAFSLAIEFRDPYTMGHQKRVAELSVAISEELGLDPEKKEGVRVAALLHDLGKAVGVPLEILNKPAKLNDLEFSFVKAHPEIGWRILKGVVFPWPVAEVVYQHHERLNGSGYPRGLKGDQIIMEARIIGVADVVEAMTSHRPYRPALSLEEARREIKENKGILYDPQVVDAALKVFEKGFSFERI